MVAIPSGWHTFKQAEVERGLACEFVGLIPRPLANRKLGTLLVEVEVD